MRAIILIPYRAQNAARERNLRAVQRWYEPLGLPVVLGDSDVGLPFNRAASRNVAAQWHLDGDWDVALFNDADCLAELEIVERAFTLAMETDRLILPHDDFWRFNERGTQRLLEGLLYFRLHPEKARRLSDQMTVLQKNRMPSGALVVSRDAFSAIGGYDEGLKGWGYEDSVFLQDAMASVGVERMPGRLWHLNHPRDTGTIEQRSEDRTLALAHRQAYAG